MILLRLSNLADLYEIYREKILELSINIIALSIVIWTVMQTIRVIIKYAWYFILLILALFALMYYV
jgi:hypothetical protein